MSQYEVFQCDACEENYKVKDRIRSWMLHGSVNIFKYGERKGYDDNERVFSGDLCHKCCHSVGAALGLDLGEYFEESE